MRVVPSGWYLRVTYRGAGADEPVRRTQGGAGGEEEAGGEGTWGSAESSEEECKHVA